MDIKRNIDIKIGKLKYNSTMFFFIYFVLFLNYSYSQDIKQYKERYIFLSKIEYEKIQEVKGEKSLNGNYYISDKIFISIKKFSNGIRTGEWMTFQSLIGSTMKLGYVANYKNGHLHGYFYTTDNHTFHEDGYYEKGKKHGLWTNNENDLLETTNYKKGEKHGVKTIVYSDRDLGYKETITYKNGKKHGKYFKTNNSFSKSTEEGVFENDLKHGLWKRKNENLYIEDENGNLVLGIELEYYKKGKLIRKETIPIK